MMMTMMIMMMVVVVVVICCVLLYIQVESQPSRNKSRSGQPPEGRGGAGAGRGRGLLTRSVGKFLPSSGSSVGLERALKLVSFARPLCILRRITIGILYSYGCLGLGSSFGVQEYLFAMYLTVSVAMETLVCIRKKSVYLRILYFKCHIFIFHVIKLERN